MDISYRPGTLSDSQATYRVFARAYDDLERRAGLAEAERVFADAAGSAQWWERQRSLFAHLAATAETFWVAESEGAVIGYARATLHDGVRELTEFFVLPERQSAGVGRELLARAFSRDGARRRVLIATPDIRATASYLKAGVYPRVAIGYLFATPRPVEITTDLIAKPAGLTSGTLAALRSIDDDILGFARDADHEHLLNNRRALLYRRGDRIVGYGYFGRGAGPIALRDGGDFPAVLAWAESEAAARGDHHFGMNVPLINRDAVDYLLARGFRLDPVIMSLMSDAPFGAFDRYIITSPPFFL